jgi:hypothetical protein
VPLGSLRPPKSGAAEQHAESATRRHDLSIDPLTSQHLFHAIEQTRTAEEGFTLCYDESFFELGPLTRVYSTVRPLAGRVIAQVLASQLEGSSRCASLRP